MELNESYWTERYLSGQIGWDIGYASPAIITYFNSVVDKQAKILIPGGGNGYEAAALYKLGFENVYLLDFAKPALETFIKVNPHFPKNQLIQSDFFTFEGTFDFIVEQTFFCALSPDLREAYVNKMSDLLVDNGKLVGLLFNIPLNNDHPPFGGKREGYQTLFEKKFELLKMEPCYNSIPPRAGNELFIELSPLKM